MPLVGRDVRYSIRLLRKSPEFTILSLAGLALGLGAATAIFSVVDAVLLKPLPYKQADRLLVIWERNAAGNKSKLPVAPANFLEWRKQTPALAGAGAWQDVTVNLTAGPAGPMEPEELRAQRISAELLPLLGVQPVVGGLIGPQQDQPGATTTALVSYGLWQRRFASDREIAGKTILLNDKNYTVAGVLPRGFRILDTAADIWIPLGLDPGDTRMARTRFLTVVARLRTGASLAEARRQLDTIGDRLERADPELNHGWRPSAFRLQEELTGDVERPLQVMMGAVGLLLLMACGNVANMLLARGNGRRREVAVRMAMGASRARIVGQLLMESVLLALAAGAFGLLLAWVTVDLLARLGPASIPRLADARLDWRVFLFALAVSTLSGALFGLAPALRSSETNLRAALVETGRGRTASRSGMVLRSVLVVLQVALGVVVLIGAGLLMRSFARLRSADLGFQPAGLTTLRLPLAGTRNALADRRVAFVEQAEDRISALAGVKGIAAVDTLPLAAFGFGSAFTAVGIPAPEHHPMALVRAATPGYFRIMGLPLLEGRDFNPSDTSHSVPVAAVSRSLARRFWRQGGALGNRLALEPEGPQVEIVGIVGDVKPYRIQGEDWDAIYRPYAQTGWRSITLVVRSPLPPEVVAAGAERAVRQLNPDQPIADARPMERVIAETMADARFNTLLFGAFAPIALVLAAIGVYSVVSYDVSQRTSEIGIRLAMGAQRADVLRLVLGRTAGLAALAIVIGLTGAWGLTRLIAGMLYGVAPTDADTFVAIPALLGAFVLMAGYLPARRALALDPAHALRHE